jgi:lipopolysaccharide transport system ATP-binding protein
VAAHLEPEILVVDEVLAVGDAEFQRKCLGKMSDVASAGRTVLFVSHNMSAILRLTERALVLDQGTKIYEGPTREAVDYYMSSGFSQSGERRWQPDEIQADSQPFEPIALRVVNPRGQVADTMLSTEPITLEMEYRLSAPIQALRVGIYLQTMQGEVIFTSFDTDEGRLYNQHATREVGHYVSRTQLPGNFLNEGQYLLGLNASAFRVKRFFQDEHALAFTVDAVGAPGMQWGEVRLGPLRPKLDWEIQQV